MDSLGFYLDVGLVQASGSVSGLLSPERIFRDLHRVPLHRPVECGMVNRDTPLGHDLLEVAIGHPVAPVEEDRMQDHVFGKLGPLYNALIVIPPQKNRPHTVLSFRH